MKNYFSNIRTLAALLIASAAFTACSNDDSSINQPVNPTEPKTYTLTLQAGKADGAQTRAFALDGASLVAKWADSDQLTVTKGETLVGTLTASNVSDDGKTCTFSGALTGTIAVSDVLTLTYHPVTSLDDYASQDGALNGTLACAADYDVATATVTVASVSGGEITISETSAVFTTQTAMLKITMKDGSDNALNATSLKITAGGTDIFTFSPTELTYWLNGNGVLYFALPSQAAVEAAQGLSSGALSAVPITFTATVGSDTYTATKTGYTFAAGKYYATTLAMEIPAAASKALSAVTTSEIGWRIGSDSKAYSATGALPSGVTAVAMIAYVGNESDCSHGLAIALEEVSTEHLTWDNSGDNNGGKTAAEWCSAWNTSKAVTGGTWRLPSIYDWQNMFIGCGASGTVKDEPSSMSHSELASKLSTAGGDALQVGSYWASTKYEYDDDYAWYLIIVDSSTTFTVCVKGDTNYYCVRACLAF